MSVILNVLGGAAALAALGFSLRVYADLKRREVRR